MSETPDSSLSSDALLKPDRNRGYIHPRAGMRETKVLPLRLQKTLLLGFLLCIAGTVAYYVLSERSEMARWAHMIEVASTKAPSAPALLNNNATTRFRDNLSPSHKYITTFNGSGFTNQVMAIVNLIYLAILTGRTPIIPQFLPEHFGTLDTVAPIAFGDFFDIPRLENALNIPIIGWDEVKVLGSSENEPVGCWSTRAGLKGAENRPATTYHPGVLNLSVAYTPTPPSFTLSRGAIESDYILSTWALASLGFPGTHEQQLNWQRSRIIPDGSGRKTEPDDQLLCFDMLYYIGLVESAPAADFFADYSPFWNLVGTHLHWKKPLAVLAAQYLRRHFGVTDDGPIPPFISVHVRRTDFKYACSADPESCFAPVRVYERRVNEVKQSLRNRTDGIEVTKIVVTSDERDPKWWEQVAALGPEWGWIDHEAERTAAKYGKWYPMILDVVIQSMGTGFVGTQHSTMSRIASKRVHDWQGGLGVEVRWGNPSADDH